MSVIKIKDAELERLSWTIWWAQPSHTNPQKLPSMLSSGSEEDVIMEEWSERCNVAHFEDNERESWVKEYGWPLEARKGKEMGFLVQNLQKGR